jgi:8-oxo-dGTP diphosphatase
MSEITQTVYCLGFLFSEDREWVVLMKKARPQWQRGKFNGMGGHVDDGETPVEAMEREALEEAGVLGTTNWEFFATMAGDDWTVHCFRAFDTQASEEANNAGSDEPLSYVPVNRLHEWETLPNVPWLIGMALDRDILGSAFVAYSPRAEDRIAPDLGPVTVAPQSAVPTPSLTLPPSEPRPND